jgi:hypothetical protein
MVATTTVEDLFDGPDILIQQVTVTGDDTTTEINVADISAYTGPDGQGNTTQVLTSRLSLMEASWNINSLVEHVTLYWTDEGNDNLILQMSGDSAISYRGMGGKHYTLPGTFAADDADVEMTYTNSAEDANGKASIWLVWKKKSL